MHGRDLLSRILFGAQVSLLVGLVGAGVSLVIGVLWGAIAGFAGGRTDRVMMRFVDVLYSLLVEFYKNILSGKLDSCQALRQAALTQKKVVQQRYGQDNPFFWGAFVFLGQAD